MNHLKIEVNDDFQTREVSENMKESNKNFDKTIFFSSYDEVTGSHLIEKSQMGL